jgi:pimeloyl-ACP methyl ester carboxylesterase
MLPHRQNRLISQLEDAFISGRPPILGNATPARWAGACHDLLEADCRLDLLEYAARLLHPAYPELTYLETIVAWFDAVPSHLPMPLDFRDRPSAEIQIVRRVNSDAVLLCFCAQQGTLGIPVNFSHLWLGRLPASLVYVKDFRNLYGGGGYPSLASDRAGSVRELRRIAESLGAARIYTLGVSLGGYAALYYGLRLGAAGALSLGGSTDLTPGTVERLGPPPAEYAGVLSQVPDYARNLRKLYEREQTTPKLLLAFSAGNPFDREQAQGMSGLPNVELVAVDDCAHHNVIDPLIRRGEYFALLSRLLSSK